MGTHPGESSPSVARSLSPEDVADLVAIAKALPPGWALTVNPPYGQLCFAPVAGRRWYHRQHAVSSAGHYGQIDVAGRR